MLDKTSLSVLSEIDLSSNPTSTSTELLIKENTLEYGLYSFKLKVIVYFNSNSNLTNEDETFIEIIPTGIAIFGLENGVNSIVIGSQQSLNLSPGVYTKDMDEVITPDTLKYQFYCKTVSSSNINGVNSLIDLKTYKNDPSLVLFSNQTCFGFKCKYFLLYLEFIFMFFCFYIFSFS